MLVIVREIEGRIAAVIYVTMHDEYIMVEMLARNKLLPYVGAAADLIRLVERYVAQRLGIDGIRMEALQHVVGYYDNVLEYEEYSTPYRDREWEMLTPKRKRLRVRP